MQEKNMTGELVKGFVFTNIFRTFRFAIQPGKLIIALLAVAVLVLAGLAMDYSQTALTASGPAGFGNAPSQQNAAYEGMGHSAGVFATLWSFCSVSFNHFVYSLVTANMQDASSDALMIVGAIWWAARYHPLYTAIYLAIALVVMAVAGGAICRSAALQFARDERPGLIESLRFSMHRLSDLVAAPLWAFGIIVIMGLMLFLFGLLGNIPLGIGPVVIGAISPLAVFMGFLMTVFIVGLAAGGSLMFPAIAYEGSDGMDAMGRAFGYIYTRPWRMAFYTLVAMVYGAICYLFVRLFAYLILLGTRTFLASGCWGYCQQASTDNGRTTRLIDAIWPKPTFDSFPGIQLASLTTPEKAGAVLAAIPHFIVAGLVIAFLVSFFFCASTVIYALLRKHVDGEGFDTIFMRTEDLPTANGDPAEA
jgi:hypothetical protein